MTRWFARRDGVKQRPAINCILVTVLYTICVFKALRLDCLLSMVSSLGVVSKRLSVMPLQCLC